MTYSCLNLHVALLYNTGHGMLHFECAKTSMMNKIHTCYGCPVFAEGCLKKVFVNVSFSVFLDVWYTTFTFC